MFGVRESREEGKEAVVLVVYGESWWRIKKRIGLGNVTVRTRPVSFDFRKGCQNFQH